MVDTSTTVLPAPLTTEDTVIPARFTGSGVATGDRSGRVERWLEERRAAHRFEVERIPFLGMRDWFFEPTTGNLAHRSGRFFTIEGIEVETDYGPVGRWQQPIINQPEIGTLGMITKDIDGVLHCLVQAKMEPGNINTLQLSPTVQATRSNYTRVHGGTQTRYLEYFTDPGRSRVLVDVLQSEQGAWFLGKRNRNVVVEVDEDVPPHEDYRWMTIGELHRMLRQDNMVNMDARTVLSCIPFDRPAAEADDRHDDSPFRRALHRSLVPGGAARHTMRELLSWFVESKARHHRRVRPIPLRQVRGWQRDDHEISHDDGKHFSIIAAQVTAGSREVHSWSQPLLVPRGLGVAALLTKSIGGVLHVLMHARIEGGYLDVAELAPTVQCMPVNYEGLPDDAQPPFLDYLGTVPAHRIMFDAVQSEEGGRFYHAENRYVIVDVGDDLPDAVPPDYRWLTVAQLTALLQHSYYVNVQARSLIACLHSLW
ncbi:NDP-hexose 2,3-dehydratase family protein [Nucisporomicrobium flavum]|uniref:NDP-hexose 2,3-dehydratase family protein n=1 Tax=Nucisporomicrobium flavum TaxID=2785915 RepID=UPI003C2EF19A